MTRVCRVAPDVTAVERTFDYLVPGELAALVRVGAIVRVPLHGRSVRGWVVADGVQPEAAGERLLAVVKVVSQGPPPAVVDLAGWVARRWAGPLVAVLRSASPPNVVAPAPGATPPGPAASGSAVADAAAPVDTACPPRVVRTPPLHDRRDDVARHLATSGSTIVVVADAARARVLAAALARGGRAVARLSSDDPDAARTDAWRRAARGAVVVVGGRIAALAPVPDLAAAIVVDDADEALQEERVPTWHARDVLHERARRSGAPFTVLSPAPSVEALHLAGVIVEGPPTDVEASGWPRTLVVDRRAEPPGAKLLTAPLADALRAAGGPAVCVLNRRGRFRLLACGGCGELERWDHDEERPLVCRACGASTLRVVRAGVARLRDELAALLAGRRVAAVDAAVEVAPPADVLIGTEAVLHRPEVRRQRPALVAYLDLDQELLAPRYRAAVQAHWLVTRGAQLLAGRPRAETLLVLQTRMPDHEVVQAVARGRPTDLARAEAERRRVQGYPPFGALAELSGTDGAVTAAVAALRALDPVPPGLLVLGPASGRALVHASGSESLAAACEVAHAAGRAAGRLRIAVDPPRV